MEICLKKKKTSVHFKPILIGNYRIYITALSSELGVSDDTLRRDLAELDELGLLTKVHGGAIARIQPIGKFYRNT